MKWILKIIVFVLMAWDSVDGRDVLEHALIISAFGESVSGGAAGPHIYLIDGDPAEIYHKHVTGGGLGAISFSLENPRSRVLSCDVNYRQAKLYLYDVLSNSVVGLTNFNWRTGFRNMPVNTFHAGVSRSIHGKIAVDYVSDNVYWVDPIFRWIALQPGNLQTVDQSNFKIIVHKDLRKPTGLAVSPVHGYMFWSDSGSVAKIERANLIGQDRTVIISTGLIQPIAIDVDHVTSEIYWVDIKRDTIESSDFHGNNRRTVRRMPHREPVDIVVFGNVVTITEYTTGKAYLLNKENGTILTNGLRAISGDKMWSLCLYTPDSQPSRTNNCPAKHCSDICVNGPTGATCLCREGYQLNTDQRTCSEVEGDKHRAVVVAGSGGICTLDIRSLASSTYNQTSCVQGVSGVNYLDIDMVNRRIYYATNTAVYSLIMGNDNSPDHIVSATDTITGLALNWRDRNIYMSMGLTAGKIVLFSQTTWSSFTVLDTDLFNPRELCLLPLDSLMLWISGSVGSYKIEMAAMDGTNRATVLHSDQLVHPKSISVDPVKLTIYWTDLGTIRRFKIDGSGIESLPIKDVTSAQLLHIYKGYLIFTETILTTTYVKSDDLTAPGEVDSYFTVPQVGTVKVIKTLDAHSQPTEKGPCEVLNGNSEQICLPVGQTKICKCEYGFTLDGNRETCSSNLVSDNFLLVTDWTHDKIYQVSFDTQEVFGLDTSKISNPVGVAFNHVTMQVIWGDSGMLIHRINLNGTGYEIVADLELHGCHADRFAIDYSTGNIFYTAVPLTQDGFAGVGLISPQGDHLRLIHDGQNPRDIVLDPEQGLLFWTDHGDSPFVKKANMDGSSVTTIISTAIVWPNGLAIDQTTKRLYLSDGVLDTIQQCSYYGSCSLLYTAMGAHLMDVVLLGQYLYFTAWNTQHITKINKDDATDISVVTQRSELGRLDSLAIYKSSETSNTVSAACAVNNGGCSTFCLATSGGGHTCTCEDYVSLRSDMKTCENVTTTRSTTRAPSTPTPTPPAQMTPSQTSQAPTALLSTTQAPMTLPPTTPTLTSTFLALTTPPPTPNTQAPTTLLPTTLQQTTQTMTPMTPPPTSTTPNTQTPTTIPPTSTTPTPNTQAPTTLPPTSTTPTPNTQAQTTLPPTSTTPTPNTQAPTTLPPTSTTPTPNTQAPTTLPPTSTTPTPNTQAPTTLPPTSTTPTPNTQAPTTLPPTSTTPTPNTQAPTTLPPTSTTPTPTQALTTLPPTSTTPTPNTQAPTTLPPTSTTPTPNTQAPTTLPPTSTTPTPNTQAPTTLPPTSTTPTPNTQALTTLPPTYTTPTPNTQAPTTLPPTSTTPTPNTQAPTTLPPPHTSTTPTTQAQTTLPPTSTTPTPNTQAPTTLPPPHTSTTPTTQAQTTLPPTSTTPTPNTQAPTTLPPTSTTPTPNTKAPKTLPPTSTTRRPNTQAPTTLPPTSTTRRPNTQAPTTLPPTSTTPTPNTQAPTTLPPTTPPLKPTVPTTSTSTTQASMTLVSTTQVPVTLAPTTLPTTTLVPKTTAPTSVLPITQAATTLPPTTLAPSTLPAPATLPARSTLPTTPEPKTPTPSIRVPLTLATSTPAPRTPAPTTLVQTIPTWRPTNPARETLRPTNTALPITLGPTPTTSTSISTTSTPPKSTPIRKGKDKSLPIPVIVGATAGSFLLIVILVVILYIRYRSTRGHSYKPAYDPYIVPIVDREVGADQASSNEYEYIYLDDIGNEKQGSYERKEDDARINTDMYNVLQPSPCPNQHPAGINYLSTFRPRQSAVNDHRPFRGQQKDVRYKNHDQHLQPSSAATQSGEMPLNFQNQLYNIQDGPQSMGLAQQQDRTPLEMTHCNMTPQNDNQKW